MIFLIFSTKPKRKKTKRARAREMKTKEQTRERERKMDGEKMENEESGIFCRGLEQARVRLGFQLKQG